MGKKRALSLLCTLVLTASMISTVFAESPKTSLEDSTDEIESTDEIDSTDEVDSTDEMDSNNVEPYADNTQVLDALPDDFPKLSTLKNLALGMPVESNLKTYSDTANNTFYPAGCVTDGDLKSFAQIAGDTISGNNDWQLTVDLRSSQDVDLIVFRKLNLGFGNNNNVIKYQVETSVDGQEWEPFGGLVEEAEPSFTDKYFVPGITRQTRYIRLTMPQASNWAVVAELEVYSKTDMEPVVPDSKYFPNLALGTKASLSETEFSGHPAGDAVDGNMDSYAQANNGQKFDLILALKESTTINTSVLKWYGFGSLNLAQRIKRFKIYTSTDGESWNEAADRALKDNELRKDIVVTFDPVEAKYVKFEIVEADEWMAINELELYDTSKTTPVFTNFASGSTVKKGTQVQLSSALEGARIYYTLDESDPITSDTRIEYTQPIEVNNDLTIKAYAVKDGLRDSDVGIFTYFMQWIEADPDSGRVDSGTKVTLTNYLEGADVYYTTDGSDPLTNGILYTAPIEITTYTSVSAYAKKGDVATPVYVFVYATENAVEGKTVTDSVNGDAFAAVDGDLNTIWTTNANGWIKVDFGSSYDFDCINIHWADDNAYYKYVVETSSDNYIWYPYAANLTGNNASQLHTLAYEENHRQYIRIKVLGAKEGSVLGIREIEVSAKESPAIPEIPMYKDDGSDLYDRVVVNPMPDYVEGISNNQISLDGEWKFTMYPQNAFWKDTADLSKWDQAIIPGDLDALGFPVYNMENPDWKGGYSDAKFYPGNNVEMVYKRQITVPEDYAGQKVFIRVDKAFSYARIWVNGQYVRDHRGEYNAWDADITGFIKPGQENWITLSIRAESSDGLGFIGLRSIRGVLSDVTMYAVPQTFLNRLHVETDFDEKYENAELTIMTNTFLESGKTADLELTLVDKNGNQVDLGNAKTIQLLAEDNFVDKNVTVQIDNPEKWDPEHPNLYTLTANVVVDGKTVETVSIKIGFREVTIENSVFKVNGLAVKLRGVDYHTVYGNDGVAYDLEAEKKLLETLKEMNGNYIRTAHYPISDRTLNLCDELGIFVEQENSSCFTGSIKPGVESHPFYKDYLLNDISEMVEKDRSHPSIVFWSIANESSWGKNYATASSYVKDISNLPTKFSWGSSVPPDADIDIHSNHYGNEGIGRHGRPTVWDEYAHSYSIGNEDDLRFDPGFRENYYQLIKNTWEQIYANPINLGGAIWCYTDNAYEGKNRVKGNSNWGQVDIWGRLKPEGWATKNVYSPVQYLGDEYVALPYHHKTLSLTYENRYENVAFNDSDMEIYASVNGGKKFKVSSDIQPKKKGIIQVNVPSKALKLGNKVTLEFYKTTNGIRRNVVTNVITLGKPTYSAPKTKQQGYKITESKQFITVDGKNLKFKFDKATGLICDGSYQGKTIIVGGPYLNLGKVDPGKWTLNSVKAEQKDGDVILTIDGNYGNAQVSGCIFTLTIDSKGTITTAYKIKNSSDFNSYEVGVSYDLPETADTLSWIRNGYLTYYPDDQLGRLEGSAVKEHSDWKREWGVEPTKAWKEDDKDFYNFGINDKGGRGTNDFRSSKTGIYYAEMGLENGKAFLSVYGDGKDSSVRASINEDQTVRLAVNHEWGYPASTLSQVPAKIINVTSGYTGAATMQLTDTQSNYDVKYNKIPTSEFINAIDASSGSAYNSNLDAYNVINNSGMSDKNTLEALHGNDPDANGMWNSQENPKENAWVQVDLGQIYDLNEMWIWNHNQQNLTDRGLKNVKIQYSVDGKDWKNLTTDLEFTDGDSEYPFQFAQANGNPDLKATNLNDGKNTPVSFGGVSARYVKITANPVPGQGTWGASYYGLSELRFTGKVDKSVLHKHSDK